MPEYTFVLNQIDAYQPFYEMNCDALRYTLDAYEADVSEERDEILAIYRGLFVVVLYSAMGFIRC